MNPLLIATTNPGKLREIAPILEGVGFELITLGDCPPMAAPEENGETFAQNARIKALGYAAATGLLTVAEDSGLEIDALGGAPGVESARFGGADSTYTRKFELIWQALREKGLSGSPARFVAALALAEPSRVIFETEGTIEGQIAQAAKGGGGFGYDPIFFYPPFNCTLAEDGERKSSVSHRAKAFAKLRAFLLSKA